MFREQAIIFKSEIIHGKALENRPRGYKIVFVLNTVGIFIFISNLAE